MDLNGCALNYNFSLQDPEFFGSFSQTIDAQCYGTPSGEIFFESAFGGTTPYEVFLNNFTVASQLNLADLNDLTIPELYAGSYILVCTDAQGCISEVEHNVLQSEELIATANITDGFAEIYVEGGAPPYSFNWSNSEFNGNSAELPPGEYTVTVFDVNGCFVEIEISVSVGVSDLNQNQFTYTLVNSEVIFTNSMSNIDVFDLSGRIVKTSVNDNSVNLSNLECGSYLLRVTDNFNKMNISRITIHK
jgi:hypothetical protein